jgi:uncharacterized membrane protein
VAFPVPSWQDYLALAFDEIRQFGATSVQVVRRLRTALVGLTDTVVATNRRDVVLQYLEHLNRSVARPVFDDQDQAMALQEDRQGLGLPRRKQEYKAPLSSLRHRSNAIDPDQCCAMNLVELCWI